MIVSEFMHNDRLITNPFWDEQRGTRVDPAEYYKEAFKGKSLYLLAREDDETVTEVKRVKADDLDSLRNCRDNLCLILRLPEDPAYTTFF